MTRSKQEDAKHQALRDSGNLHPHPDKVTDEMFLQEDFFDSRDLVQVKYEMLRRVRVDGERVQSTSCSFGLSRPTYYLAQEAYQRTGLVGLLPAKRGPRRAHKLSVEVMDFVRGELVADKSLRTAELARRVKKRFDITVNPRSIQRALSRRQKKTE